MTVTVFKNQPCLAAAGSARRHDLDASAGRCQGHGKTPLQLASDITVKLKKFIQDPNVTVVMSQINSKVIYLIGEIGKPARST